MISVYIASPYSIGSKIDNVKASFQVYNKLVKRGYYPFAPLTSHYINQLYRLSYDKWLEIDMYWLDKCDCLLRLPGESRGADKELNRMVMLKKPIFYNINDLDDYYKDK
jgi:hypothetical protein